MPKPAVIYQHGLCDCCAGIVSDGEKSLGLRLVNAGFDLWMNNSRGNRYSRDHQWIDIQSRSSKATNDFFKYSFAEMGKYD